MSLAAENLTLRVPGRTLVEGLDLEIRPGERWAVLGPNGSGKTSLLLALAGLREPAAGRVRLEGEPLGDRPRRLVAQAIGMLLQEEPEEFWGSAADYVELGRLPHRGYGLAPDTSGRVLSREALDAVDLGSHAGQPYRTLSGGERQRARIAQLMAQAPRYLLADEPLNHLDLRHQLAVMERFAALADAGRAVVMALHEPWLAARFCDHALLLYDSSRFAAGPASELLGAAGLESLYGCRLDAFAEAGRRLMPPDST